ncbi:hypothetical protein NMYAN_30218 [Nitrosomonas nitrosa]|uniref:Uncharacterized protein n=1 Tax=Nitrosomonas nitrosa TaxID=52442 RepID=A0A8H8Z1Q6_9PROT|nr:hypothetical protein NMYAN_30218 [Nitrosomonas nitrosa]
MFIITISRLYPAQKIHDRYLQIELNQADQSVVTIPHYIDKYKFYMLYGNLMTNRCSFKAT